MFKSVADAQDRLGEAWASTQDFLQRIQEFSEQEKINDRVLAYLPQEVEKRCTENDAGQMNAMASALIEACAFLEHHLDAMLNKQIPYEDVPKFFPHGLGQDWSRRLYYSVLYLNVSARYEDAHQNLVKRRNGLPKDSSVILCINLMLREIARLREKSRKQVEGGCGRKEEVEYLCTLTDVLQATDALLENAATLAAYQALASTVEGRERYACKLWGSFLVLLGMCMLGSTLLAPPLWAVCPNIFGLESMSLIALSLVWVGTYLVGGSVSFALMKSGFEWYEAGEQSGLSKCMSKFVEDINCSHSVKSIFNLHRACQNSHVTSMGRATEYSQESSLSWL